MNDDDVADDDAALLGTIPVGFPVTLRVGDTECHLGEVASLGWPHHLAALLRDTADAIETVAGRRASHDVTRW